MYERHWMLERAPFDHERSPEFFYTGRLHSEALLKLKYLIEHSKGAAALVGASGVGKTHVLEIVRQQSEPLRPFVHVVYPQLSPLELVTYITDSLADPTDEPATVATGLDGLLRKLECRLQELTLAKRSPVIVIDDAHLIEDRRVFQALHQLMNLQQPGRSNFTLILSGQPELVGSLQRTDQISDRIAFHCLLQALTKSECGDYIRHRLQAAGGSKPIFDDSAYLAIFELSAGIPRRINRLCDFALLVGYANEMQQITADQVEDVHAEITHTRRAA